MLEIRKKENETIGSMLRRFTRGVQQSGILIRARKGKFYVPAPKKRAVRERALRRLKVLKERERLAKLGKLVEEEK